jgi:RNA polymerase sigma-70 factor (ECF subfamily)
MRDAVLSDVERLGALDDAERSFQMNEEAFRAFYEATARPVWLFLARMTGDSRLADDLLQETYYRFLRASPSFDNDDHRRHYLFRIATNLVHDHHRQPRATAHATVVDGDSRPGDVDPTERAVRHIDLARALGRLKPRERSMLWLAYAQGCSHEEIAARLGVKAASLKSLLHRARRRLVAILGPTGKTGGMA